MHKPLPLHCNPDYLRRNELQNRKALPLPGHFAPEIVRGQAIQAQEKSEIAAVLEAGRNQREAA